MDRQTGFTLVELMVTLTVLAILIAVGVPGFAQFVQGQRTTTQVNELIGILNLARSEALTRGRPVAIRSMDGDFNTGFQLWRDGNNNGAYNDAADELLRDFQAPDRATYAFPTDPMVFQPNGWLGGTYTLNVLADNCKQENNRTITISRTGAVDVVRNACP